MGSDLSDDTSKFSLQSILVSMDNFFLSVKIAKNRRQAGVFTLLVVIIVTIVIFIVFASLLLSNPTPPPPPPAPQGVALN